jgi:putative transposase
VVMPEHVHLLVSEPEHVSLSIAVQSLKQSVTRRLGNRMAFWQRRYYDFNVSRNKSGSKSCATCTATQ